MGFLDMIYVTIIILAMVHSTTFNSTMFILILLV